jgi:type IV fimbrial biogenesis protein FimT
MNNNRKHHGFTLIEVMTTLAVASILISLAIPSFAKMIERNRISTATNEFMAALMLTRSEAVTRTIPISICASDTGTSCNNTLNDYAKGWVIFSDCNGDGLFDASTSCDFDGDGTNDKDTVINVHHGFDKLLIEGSGVVIDKFTYGISGRPAAVPSPSFKIGPDSTSIKKKITIALTGRVKICSTADNGNCK